MKHVTLLAVMGASLLAAATVHAAPVTIYSDNFSRTGGLDGSAPDVRSGSYGGSSAATWIAGGNWTVDGSQAKAIYAPTAALSFTPETGRVYTLSATINSTAANQWLAMGFSSLSGGKAENAAYYDSLVAPQPWVLVQTSGTGHDSFLAGLTGGGSLGDAANPVAVQIILDTQPALWTVEWKINGGTQRNATYATNPTINYVSLGASAGAGNNTAGYVDNFMLTTEVVPEPSALALLGLGALGLLRRHRD